MLFDKLSSNPAKVVPVAMMLLVTGLMLLVVAGDWPRLSYPAGHFGLDNSDLLRGFLFGVAIAFEIASLVILTTFAAAKSRKA
ncbi:MAG: hypothetical protein ABR928_10195 [Terracidiphilus sp.]|jgi:hypothetical protein